MERRTCNRARTEPTTELRPGRTIDATVIALDGQRRVERADTVVTEEPLELRLVAEPHTATLGVILRTPGNDFELAAGFAYAEGIVTDASELIGISYCLDPQLDPHQQYNVVNLELARPELPDLSPFERRFAVNSACGVCGRGQIDDLRARGIAPIADDVTIAVQTLYALPERMRAAQRVFDTTGGLHAAALFDPSGELLALREDVGRHNAVDKIVGWALMERRLPLRGCVLMVSGRAGYEIVQKGVVARIPVVASVSAPSSLAVHLAAEFELTLAGFLRDARANLYSAPHRVLFEPPPP